MTPELTDLIARLEAAPEPTRELFEAAYVACFGTFESLSEDAKFHHFRFLTLLNVGAWTDAAMMLVPGGLAVGIVFNPPAPDNEPSRAWIYAPTSRPKSDGATPAIALASAALKARAASEASQEDKR